MMQLHHGLRRPGPYGWDRTEELLTAEGRHIEVRGTVQGVGFRPWIWRLARETGVNGRVSNDSRGVTIEAFGRRGALDTFLDGIRSSPPPAAEIRDLSWRDIPAEEADGFVIVASRATEGLEVSIPPDLATCAACLAEVRDPSNRRYRYAFTNCTNCGPRFTIAREVPYDRPATTMSEFPMCAFCRAEYEDPADRRFHAQPNACPACGPTLRLLSPQGEPAGGADPILGTARALVAGLVVAVKGLGGFHLACDATSPDAVARLRRRKRREEKPFAVMVLDLEAAGKYALLSPAERALLASTERPIVLVPAREGSPIAPEVSPDTPLVGLMLPYTPLHHLLLAETGRPLVMTSGNFSEEPIVCENSDAIDRLSGVADLFLVHDRKIESRCDDSVVRLVAGRPTVLRRSRGWVPRSIPVDVPFSEPVLACGGHLKNTFAIGLGGAAYMGPHIGDLENVETLTAYEEAIARLERFLRVSPELVAHDLHPHYVSTAYARTARAGRRIPVQHHHAHVASAMAEHGLAGPVLGVAWDGTGYGTDGTAWGGEILLAEAGRYERLATFRPLALPGGETAIREVWRLALALLGDAYPEGAPIERLSLFDRIDPRRIEFVRQMLARDVSCPRARGVGRFFDAFGALFLERPVSRYEGQVATAWNCVADESEPGAYPFAIDGSEDPPELDLRPAVRAAVQDFLADRGPSLVSARFHNTLARATGALVRRAFETTGPLPIVLTGGCFQNDLLARRVVEELSAMKVFLHGSVPPGDGGLSLGQALVASAIASRGGV
jgi:hydrogenase maturation protein HypF